MSSRSSEGGSVCSDHVDSLFDELLATTETDEHRRRRDLVPRIKRVARVLLSIYQTAQAKSDMLADLEEWVGSPAFTNLFRALCTLPLRQDLLPALRLLCHLQALCLKRSSATSPVEACTPSSVNADAGHQLGGAELDMPASERYDILKHLLNVSVTPLFDFDGTVLWESVLAAEMAMCKFLTV